MPNRLLDVTIYTDGSCIDNSLGHGRSGYCAILVMGEHERVVSGHIKDGTNNIAELTAILEGLKTLKYPCRVTIFTDSQFAIGTLTKGWKRKDFECAKVSKQIDDLLKVHEVTFEHIYGHTGHSYNERCDSIASGEARRTGKQ